MNYRHIFHAGNFADTFKHSVLTLLLSYLLRKDKPCTFIDTHAGLGLYDLEDEQSKRTGEAEQGILKLLKAQSHIPELDEYLRIVKQYLNGKHSFYPGSPLFMKAFQRNKDVIILNELHKKDIEVLRENFAGSKGVHIHHRDAYEFLPAILPPVNKRGLILIDPPFEKTNELQQFQHAFEKAFLRFPTGIFMLWYPIINQKTELNISRLMRSLPQNSLRSEVIIRAVTHDSKSLNGSGLIIVNPPYKVEVPIQKIASYLQAEFSDL